MCGKSLMTSSQQILFVRAPMQEKYIPHDLFEVIVTAQQICVVSAYFPRHLLQ
jgi:hypothetical protein